MHSISTSVLRGSVLTATHLLHTVVSKPRKAMRSAQGPHLRPAWLNISPVGHVDLIHLGKVVHVGQEHINLDDFVDVAAGRLKYSGQVLDALVLSLSVNPQPQHSGAAAP